MKRLIIVLIYLISATVVVGQDLTGKWVGYIDQVAGYESANENKTYQESSEYTHDLTLTLFHIGIAVKGLYHVATKGHPDDFGKFIIDGSYEGISLTYNAQIKKAIGAAFCFNSAELIYSKRDGVEYLEGGDWNYWSKEGKPCASVGIYLRKVENTDATISNMDISGVWKGYDDQTAAASTINVFQYYWEVGTWKKGEPTGIVEVSWNQKRNTVTGEYLVRNSGDSSTYAIYQMKGWVENEVLTVMSFEIVEHNYSACEFWTSLIYSIKDGIESLEGESLQDHYVHHCPASVIALSRERKIPQTVILPDSLPILKTVNLVAGAKITLDKVQFDQSSYVIKEDAVQELDRVVGWMNTNLSMVIQLEGHTDNQGVAKLNMKLSENRVKAIKEYLIRKGIKSKRIKIKAYGQTKPIASNKNPETRKLNRRVEMVVLEN